MEEYTNLTEPTETESDSDLFTDDDDLFGDFVGDEDEREEETETQTEEAGETSGGDPEAEPPKDRQQTLKIKYNGEEKEITLEEAVTLAQKGMNYDKVAAERDRLRAVPKNEKALEVIEEFARMNGMTADQYVEFLQNQQKRIVADREMNGIREKYPDAPEELLKEVAETRIESRRRQAAEKDAAQKTQAEEDARKPWADLLREYPEIKKAEDLPEDVVADIRSGLSPVDAMRRHQIKEKDKEIAALKARLEARETNEKNKKRSVGSAASTAANAEKDAFLSGFDGW